MLCGHIDTVGVEGMPAPFDPVERDGRLYGRGSQDMKGGVAAMIDAARARRAIAASAGRLIVAAVVDEEYASLGADALVTQWRADAAVVTEPTDLQIAIGHKGFAWFEIETRGRAAHGSRPARRARRDPAHGPRAARARSARSPSCRPDAPHPVMGTASLHASIIDGGRELSSYPDRCRCRLERRTVVGETAESFMGEIEEILAALRQEDPEFEASATLAVRASAVRDARGSRSAAGARALRPAVAGSAPAERSE